VNLKININGGGIEVVRMNELEMIQTEDIKKLEDLMDTIIIKIDKLTENIILEDRLTYEEKFNYLKSELLKKPTIKITYLSDFLEMIKELTIFMQLQNSAMVGNEDAKKLFDDLRNDKDIKKKIGVENKG